LRLPSLFQRARSPELPQELAQRLSNWQQIDDQNQRAALDEVNLVVVDVETSGLDPRRDRLLAIGACKLRGRRLCVGEGFERIVFQEQMCSRDNILVHGIAPSEQKQGVPPEDALMDFLDYAGKYVLVAYHAYFDRTVLDRAARAALGTGFTNLWLDLAYLAPALCPEARLPHASLDEWLTRFDIRVRSRHRAMDDVLATGELLLIMVHRALRRGITTIGELVAESHAQEARGY